jgi:hypothetical protein
VAGYDVIGKVLTVAQPPFGLSDIFWITIYTGKGI